MTHVHVMKLVTLLLGFSLLIGLGAIDAHAQTSAPSAPPTQKDTQQAPGATDKTAPQATTPETRSDRPPAQPSPNVTIENRTERRAPDNNRGGKILGVDPLIAMVIGAVLVVIIVIALVAMAKRTEDVPTHRSV